VRQLLLVEELRQELGVNAVAGIAAKRARAPLGGEPLFLIQAIVEGEQPAGPQ